MALKFNIGIDAKKFSEAFKSILPSVKALELSLKKLGKASNISMELIDHGGKDLVSSLAKEIADQIDQDALHNAVGFFGGKSMSNNTYNPGLAGATWDDSAEAKEHVKKLLTILILPGVDSYVTQETEVDMPELVAMIVDTTIGYIMDRVDCIHSSKNLAYMQYSYDLRIKASYDIVEDIIDGKS